jgi:hypothetical protein
MKFTAFQMRKSSPASKLSRMLPFIVIFAVVAAIAFVFFSRSLRLDPPAALFASLLSAILLGVITAAAIHIGALF